jgi:hypothetical protein
MPYTLNKTNGLVLAVVQDGKIEDTTTDLTFVGKNYTGYGEAFNENFVKLLESFANPNQPKKPLSGQLWFDSSNKVIKVYNGSMFKRLGQLESGPNEPSNPNKGDLWYRTSDGALCVFNGATWTKIGPAITQGLTGAVLPATLTDTNSVAHTVLKQDIGNATVVVASNDAFAIPNADDFYTRFNVIKQGLSLPNVTAEGISGNIDPLTGNRNGYLFWGTSGSALGLVKTDSGTGLNTFISANEYLQRSELSSFSGNLTVNNSDGVLVGIGGVLKMHVTESTKGNISVVNGNQLKFNILNNGDPYYNIFYLTTGTNNTPKILPNPSANVSLGDSGTGNSFSSLYVKTINATTFAATTVTASLFVGSGAGLSTGTISNNSLVNNSITITNGTGIQGGGVVALGGVLTLTNGGVTSLVGTTYQISATSPTGGVTLSLPQNINTTATVTFKELKLTTLRTVNTTTTATIYGNWILGPGATFQATYADVAERYASDADYAPGTALVIGGTAEVTMTTKHGDTARAGIVSTNPAYRLNSTAGNDITHPYIALKGKVPCKVVGPISKGDFVVTSTRAGFAERMQDGDSPLAVLGRALSSFDGDIGIIEVMVV